MDYAFQRRAGGGVQPPRHAAREVGSAAGEYGVVHGFGHQHRILRAGDSCIHEDGVSSEFHGDGGVGCGAYTSIHDEGNGGDHLAQDANVSLILNAHAAADGSAERHYRGGASVDEALGENDVVGSVGQDGETFADQDAGSFERGLDIRVERSLVADDFELYPVRDADLAAEAGGADGFVGGIAAGGVGQQEIFLGIDVVEQRLFTAVEVDAADGDRDHVGSAGLEGAGRFLEGFVFSRTDDQAGAEGAACDDEWIGHVVIVTKGSATDIHVASFSS